MRSFLFAIVCLIFLQNNAFSEALLSNEIEYINIHTIPKKKIVLIGDKSHFDKSNHDNFSKLLTEATKNDGYDCIFLEFDSRLQTYFNEYTADSNLSLSDVFTNATIQIADDRVISSSKEVSEYFSEVFYTAKRLNFKIIAADIDFSTIEGRDALAALDSHLNNPTNTDSLNHFATLLVENRNKKLAKKIKHYLESKVCTKTIVYFGDGHFQDSYEKIPVKSVQHFLTVND